MFRYYYDRNTFHTILKFEKQITAPPKKKLKCGYVKIHVLCKYTIIDKNSKFNSDYYKNYKYDLYLKCITKFI